MKKYGFKKMHGLGNDFLIFNEINESLLNPKFIRKISLEAKTSP